MNEQEYIRKAVELADGWSIDKRGHIHTALRGHFGFWEIQEIQDALAAQLVRQIDAPALDADLESTKFGVDLYLAPHSVKALVTFECKRDRTMNTIKAIVDSKVLENA